MYSLQIFQQNLVLKIPVLALMNPLYMIKQFLVIFLNGCLSLPLCVEIGT